MSKSGRGYGKSLKGVVSVGSQGFNQVNANNIVASSVKTENFEVTGFLSNGIFSDIQVQSGTINNTIIGAGGAAAAYFRDIYVGKADPAQGYPVYFYSDTPDDYFLWDPTASQVHIEGNQYIRDNLRVSNLEITGNTLQSYRNIDNPLQPTDPNGYDIIFDPTGAGIVRVNGPLIQQSGGFQLISNTAGSIQSTHTLSLNTLSGDVALNPGTNKPLISIVAIQIGTQSLITCATLHFLQVGDFVDIQGTNTAPHFNGSFQVTAVPTNTQIRVDNPITVLVPGSTGTLRRQSNIILNPANKIIVPNSVPLHMGQAVLSGTGNVVSLQGLFQAQQQAYSVEHVSVSAQQSGQPSLFTNVTFISMSGTGVATGTMPSGMRDGFFKIINAASIGGSYELSFPGNLIDPGTGGQATKKAVFTSAGQGLHLVWHHVLGAWFIINGGAFIV